MLYSPSIILLSIILLSIILLSAINTISLILYIVRDADRYLVSYKSLSTIVISLLGI